VRVRRSPSLHAVDGQVLVRVLEGMHGLLGLCIVANEVLFFMSRPDVNAGRVTSTTLQLQCQLQCNGHIGCITMLTAPVVRIILLRWGTGEVDPGALPVK